MTISDNRRPFRRWLWRKNAALALNALVCVSLAAAAVRDFDYITLAMFIFSAVASAVLLLVDPASRICFKVHRRIAGRPSLGEEAIHSLAHDAAVPEHFADTILSILSETYDVEAGRIFPSDDFDVTFAADMLNGTRPLLEENINYAFTIHDPRVVGKLTELLREQGLTVARLAGGLYLFASNGQVGFTSSFYP
jgi:hypothetical protein